MSKDQRTDYRAPIELRVDYKKMNTFFADYTKNISKGGTFIKTTAPLPIGTRFVFRLGIPGFSDNVELQGEVRFVLDAESAARSNAEPGMGIRFIFDDEAARQAFEGAVEKLMIDSLAEEIYRQLLGRTA